MANKLTNKSSCNFDQHLIKVKLKYLSFKFDHFPIYLCSAILLEDMKSVLKCL